MHPIQLLKYSKVAVLSMQYNKPFLVQLENTGTMQYIWIFHGTTHNFWYVWLYLQAVSLRFKPTKRIFIKMTPDEITRFSIKFKIGFWERMKIFLKNCLPFSIFKYFVCELETDLKCYNHATKNLLGTVWSKNYYSLTQSIGNTVGR